MRGDGGHLARLVRLDAADRHERVAALRERLGYQVFELARLVAAEREAAVAVLAFGVKLDLAAEMIGEALERLDRRRPEGQRITVEALQVHGRGPLVLGERNAALRDMIGNTPRNELAK